ncbi:MAG TPA: hypothetical protein VLL54_03570 [Pyrinomonadaceae bacterium]|nr:hypothetical protein [Pyrinomonadaceae bacterium]
MGSRLISESDKDKFDVRYYRWSMADAQREFEQNLPFLRSVQEPSALATLQYLEKLSPDQRQSFMLASVRKANGRALELLGEELTQDECDQTARYTSNILPLVTGFVDKLFYERYLGPDKETRPKKSRLASLVKQKLNRCCGKVVSADSRLLWAHETTVEEWKVHTSIDMGGSPDLRYTQSIDHPDGESSLKNVISMHRWLGFHHTEWWLSNELQEAAAAVSIEKLCRHFLEAVPHLITGISP